MAISVTSAAASQPQAGVLAAIIAVVVLFWLGIVARGALEKSDHRLTRKQLGATLLMSFVLFGLPYCHAINQAVLGPLNVLLLFSAAVPPVLSGFTSREQIKKFLAGS